MSLTSYLTRPGHLELKQKFREEFPQPPFYYQNDIKADPLTKNYGIIGTAFDYIFRFTIHHHNKQKEVDCTSWIAEMAYMRLKDYYFDYEKDIFKKRYQRAKTNHEKFLKDGKITKAFIADALFLAKLDLYFRTNLIAPDMFTESELDIKDLNALYASINISDFLVKNKCILNPGFGNGSLLVGGADADIILDDTLIDIKVTKHLKLEREYLNQLLGYYILAMIGGVNEKDDYKMIKKIGVYFARHGFLWTIPLSHFGSSEKFEAFKLWFIEYFQNINLEYKIELQERIKFIKKQLAKEKRLKKIRKKIKR